MAANEHQVGGTHYKSSYIHWDFVLATGMQYLEGNATKYLARCGKKGKPVEDLEKALHYVEKAIENATLISLVVRIVRNFLSSSSESLEREANRFCADNDIHGYTWKAVRLLTSWRTKEDLIGAATHIRAAIKERQDAISRGEAPPAPRPVPLNDSNKHADRSA